MFKKNLKRKVFSLVIVAMLFTSTVSFGSGFGNSFSTYRFCLPLLSNFQWRQIPIFRLFEPEKPVEEKPEAPVEDPETPEDPVEVEKPEVPEKEEKPEAPEEIEIPETPEKPEKPEKPEVPEDEKPEEPTEPEKPVEPEKPETPEQPEEKPEEKPEERPVEEENSNSVSQEEQEVLRLVNIEREKAGLSALKLSSKLSHVARDKSKDMAHNNYFSHNSPTHGSPFDMMKAYGINYRTAGENIAKGYNSAQSVVNGWMNSPGHRANILNSSFGTLGVGYYNHNGTTYWTQMFTD